MDRATITQTVEGVDGRFWFLFIPFGGAPNLEEAVDRCLDAGNGDFIERVRLYETGWSILLFSYGSYKIIGDVGNSKVLKPEMQKAEAPAIIPSTPAVPARNSAMPPLVPAQTQSNAIEKTDAVSAVPASDVNSGTDPVTPENVDPDNKMAQAGPEGGAENVHADAAVKSEPENLSIQTEDLGGLLSEENP